MTEFELLNKYNVPVPRYTSYPTVPYWSNNIDKKLWEEKLRQRFLETNNSQGISLYIHLPFCESLCTYCGCNKKITTNHSIEKEYIDAVITEWKMYQQLMMERPVIREIHLGGGTPTFFSPANLSSLIQSILAGSVVHADANFSFEAHPNNTTREHLGTLYQLGFRRVSYGVQDNDPVVQRIINRIQPFENIMNVTGMARDIGYESVNYDLIYGLPKQTLEGIKETINSCITQKPDRVAFYSYAHVPWTSRGQRLFDENDLPEPVMKMKLYQAGRNLFLQNNYQDIGMDHFALRSDSLCSAFESGSLHRNFMGYTDQHTGLILGLGVSSISDAGNAFVQNSKSLHDYYSRLQEGVLPVEKGYYLEDEDLIFRKYILDISCKGEATFSSRSRDLLEAFSFPFLSTLQEDGLVNFDADQVKVTPLGRNYLRNVCSAFDLHLLRKSISTTNPTFSRAI